MNIYNIIYFAIYLNIVNSLSANIFIEGISTPIKANGNSKEKIITEIKTINITEIANTGETFKIQDVKIDVRHDGLVITNDEFPKNDTIQYKCVIYTDKTSINGKSFVAFDYYIKLRFNGFSSFGTLKMLKMWLDDPSGGKFTDLIIDMPVSGFEKIEVIPKWLLITSSKEFFEVGHKKSGFYIFKDGELAWLLESNENKKFCRFIYGIDGRHFNTTGFNEVFTKEAMDIGKGTINERQSIELAERLKKTYGIEWHSPFEISLPGV